MIVTMELPDNIHILNIGIIDSGDRYAVSTSFTKAELEANNRFISKSSFIGFPADIIDGTLDIKPEELKYLQNDVNTSNSSRLNRYNK